MKPPKPPGVLRTSGTRREFFRASARYTALSIIGLVASYMLGRRKSQGACLNRNVCGACPLWVDCTLPPALARKEVDQ